MKDTEQISLVEEFLSQFDLYVERLSPKKYPNRKIPDFKITNNDGTSIFCEVKSLQLNLDPKLKCYKHVTTMGKISQHIHGSVKQFNSFNLNHNVPNTLIWTSDHFQLNYSNLIASLTGMLSDGKNIYRNFNDLDFCGRIKNDFKIIDLHIWLQINSNGIYDTKYIYTTANKDFRNIFFNIFNHQA